MKTFLRLFRFATPLQNYAVPFFFLSILGVIFGLMNFTLLIPIFELLFDQTSELDIKAPAAYPEFSLDLNYFKELFYYNFQQIMNSAGKIGALQMVCVIIVISVILSNLFKYLAVRVVENFRLVIITRIRSAIFKKLTEMDLQFFGNHRKGDLISKFMTDVNAVQDSIIRSMQVILREPLTIILNFAVLFYISAELTFFALILIPVSGVVITTIVKKLKRHATAQQQAQGVLMSSIDEGLSGVKIIKSFNAESYVQNKFEEVSMWVSKLNRRLARRVLLASPVSEMLGVITVAALLYYGGTIILETGSDLGGAEFIGYIIIFSQVITPAKAFSEAFGNISQGIAAGERIFELLDEESHILDKSTAISKSSLQSEIDIRNVSFNYGEKRVLNDISFRIPKGSTVALVGPSGGGKTTLMDLLPRFMDPVEGIIAIDGVDIRDVRMKDLRALMGIVNQESILFNDTIHNNIAFGRKVSREEVIQAARIANAHEFIELTEHSYDTNIGDRGMKLSGGQKQRLSIARAVLANPEILLLDEATSALDTESEKLVQKALNTLMLNRTTVVIAHRLSTIKNAHMIVVLDQGTVVETGTHFELYEKDGLYRRLIEMQTFNS